jgi:hypothetical protein
MSMEPGVDRSLRNADRFLSEYRDDEGKLVLRVRVAQQEQPVDFRWLRQPRRWLTIVRRLATSKFIAGNARLKSPTFPTTCDRGTPRSS